MNRPGIQYATTSDGVRIAYFDAGEGHPLIWVPSVPLSNIEMAWDLFGNLFPGLASWGRVIAYDPRGIGRSDRSRKYDYPLDDMLLDLEAVLARTGLGEFAIAGDSTGAPIAVAAAGKWPGRVTHLILVDACACRAAYPMPPAMVAFDAVRSTAVDLSLEVAGQALFGFGERLRSRWAEYAAAAYDTDTGQRVEQVTSEWDVRDLLPTIAAPALVVEIPSHRWVPAGAPEDLAAALPQGELVSVDDPDFQQLSELAREFILRHPRASRVPPVPAPASSFRTILFTDVVSSTPLLAELKDEKMREVMRDHDRIMHAAVEANGGRVIKTIGDAFMAEFAAPSAALLTAIQMQQSIRDHFAGTDVPVRIRIGVNAGEPVAEEGDLHGLSVVIAKRLESAAEDGGILVSDVVRQAVAGKSFEFEDRGPLELKGIPDPVRAWSLHLAE